MDVRKRIFEVKKQVVKNLCVNKGPGSGGGFTACNKGAVTKSGPSSEKGVRKALIHRVKELQSSKVEVIRKNAMLIAKTEARIEAQIKSGDTRKSHTDASGNYTAARQEVHRKVIESILTAKDARPKDGVPVAVFLGGLPGSGKSTATKGFDTKNKIVVDPDEIKGLLGKFGAEKFTGGNAAVFHRESGDVADMLYEISVKKGLNVVVDATMKTKGEGKHINDGVLGKINAAKARGFRSEIRFVDVSIDTSATRAMNRFVSLEKRSGNGRYVPINYIKSLARDAPPPPGVKRTSQNRQTFEAVKSVVDAYVLVNNNGGPGEEKIIQQSGKMTS